jgi:hypothetical protein
MISLSPMLETPGKKLEIADLKFEMSSFRLGE